MVLEQLLNIMEGTVSYCGNHTQIQLLELYNHKILMLHSAVVLYIYMQLRFLKVVTILVNIHTNTVTMYILLYGKYSTRGEESVASRVLYLP